MSLNVDCRDYKDPPSESDILCYHEEKKNFMTLWFFNLGDYQISRDLAPCHKYQYQFLHSQTIRSLFLTHGDGCMGRYATLRHVHHIHGHGKSRSRNLFRRVMKKKWWFFFNISLSLFKEWHKKGLKQMINVHK